MKFLELGFYMSILQWLKKQKKAIQPNNRPQGLEQSKKTPSGDIHKVEDGQVIPTAAPNEVEQDISPGIPTQQ